MKMTPIDIQEKRFRTKFRGFDVREVDAFLEQVAQSVQNLHAELQKLTEENKRLHGEAASHRQTEDALRQELENSKKTAEELRVGTRKSADLIIGDAEVRASKMLSRTHNRLSQLHEDIAELKRQRRMIEDQIRAVITHHGQLLEMKQEEMTVQDSAYDSAATGEEC